MKVRRHETDGRVRVAVRIRPLLPREIEQGHRCTKLEVDSAAGLVSLTDIEEAAFPGSVGASRRTFRFDTVIGETVGQEGLYESVGLRDMVKASLKGINVSVIAYGQTGQSYSN